MNQVQLMLAEEGIENREQRIENVRRNNPSSDRPRYGSADARDEGWRRA
jgi:hypothetical protein